MSSLIEKHTNEVSFALSAAIHIALFLIVLFLLHQVRIPAKQAYGELSITISAPPSLGQTPKSTPVTPPLQTPEAASPFPQNLVSAPIKPEAHPAPVNTPAKTSPPPQIGDGSQGASGTASPGTPMGVNSDAELIQAPTPVYPKTALNNDWTGTIIVEVTIDEDGKLKNIHILQSTGHENLDQSFLRTLKNTYQFKPKLVLGKPAESSLKLSYSFKLNDL